MIERREPILMCATGKKGVGKTYTTMGLINSYIKPNKKTGKKVALKILKEEDLDLTEQLMY